MVSTVLSPFLYPFFWPSQQLPEANAYFSPSGLDVQFPFPFTSIVFLFFLSHLSGTAFTTATHCLKHFNPEQPLCDDSLSNIPASTFFPHQCHQFLGFHDLILSGTVPSFIYGCAWYLLFFLNRGIQVSLSGVSHTFCSCVICSYVMPPPSSFHLSADQATDKLCSGEVTQYT